MATAGTPPSTIPVRARATRSTCQLGATAARRVSSAASAMEVNISPRRPSACEQAPAMTMEKASRPVVSDRASELSTALRA